MAARPLRYFLAVVVAAALSGCGGGDSKLPIQSVSGKLTLDGEPNGPAAFLMLPVNQDAKNPRPSPAGSVDAEGNITVSCYAKGDGAPAGDYKIQFTPNVTGGAPKKPIPPLYFSPEGGGLTVTVAKADGPSDISLKLDSKPAGAAMSPGSAATMRPGGGKNYPAIDPKLMPKTE